MGIPTLITTNTHASDVAASEFTANINNTYMEYMFVFTDINPATDNTRFQFQGTTDGSTWGITATSSAFRAHNTVASSQALDYQSGEDLASSSSYQTLNLVQGNVADECCGGILHLFDPSNTTYMTNWLATTQGYMENEGSIILDSGGYFMTTSAVTGIRFKMNTGNFTGTIQMFGIA